MRVVHVPPHQLPGDARPTVLRQRRTPKEGMLTTPMLTVLGWLLYVAFHGWRLRMGSNDDIEHGGSASNRPKRGIFKQKCLIIRDHAFGPEMR